MHMADALISPAVGGVMWVASASLAAFAAKKVQNDLDDRKIPLMGVLGAFVFAAQMINFTIPGTGSSGHICGGLLLAILLGPQAAALTIASILTIQCLFFADGGLLALGANIFNMGFLACFIAYPLIYKPLTANNPSKGRIYAASILASVIGLQLGAFSVVLETLFSGISELPFGTFVLLMQPIHLAIGLVEGLVTATIIIFVMKESPEILRKTAMGQAFDNIPIKGVFITLLVAAVLTSGALSWFASANPDGLEWSIAGVTGEGELKAPEGIHSFFAELQEKTAFLPDYNFKQPEKPAAAEANAAEEIEAWPAVDSGTSFAGILGSLLTLALAYSIGKGLRRFAKE
ncbi:Fused nickel transport protein NikMN [Sporomusa ovata DSM 2662]|uniref:Substrate-specific component NikM of nickel ECF transporter / Additional substrate-specific component NikN of nickel ECF transporter n=1 Tax=Sporomusa ovata TaxID=2378 RepID=A0A0U1KUL6_9FIRM|nr:energy-coupling factor ABC transporter permease [Sporomusa ovata]EQB27001.1 c obalamin (vitamin B12) biosynthesis protein CbiM [Sporomusa ovata DSM 2662]CQR71108.1 Substrate-specific component NikM of nickel ECF transporter / Additional substrate-specific component NikN of nickel ECF transporter [Sporomusa ovata]